MRLLLVKDEFFFPTLMVVTRQFQSREQRVIEQVSRQTMGLAMAGPLWVIQRVLDHPHDDAVAVLVSILRRGIILARNEPSGNRWIDRRIKLSFRRIRSLVPRASSFFQCAS